MVVVIYGCARHTVTHRLPLPLVPDGKIPGALLALLRIPAVADPLLLIDMVLGMFGHV